MFDFIRDLAKSADEKQRERLHAFIDGELSAAERQAFEQQLAADPALQAEVDSLRLVKASMRSLPQARAPRNFTLDPAVYGRPEAERRGQLLPVLRVATALTAVLFVSVLVLDLVGFTYQEEILLPQLTSDMAANERSAEIVVEGEPVEVTRVVTEMVEAERGPTSPAEAAAGEAADADTAAEDSVEEEAMEEEAATEEVAVEEAAEVPEAPATAVDTDDGAAVAADESYPAPPAFTGAPEAAYPAATASPSPAGANLLITPTERPEPATAVADETQMSANREAQEPLSPLRLAQYILGVALLLFLGALLLIHRR